MKSDSVNQSDLNNPLIANARKYRIFESHPAADDGVNTETAWGSWCEWTNSKERDYDKIQAY